MPRMDAPPPSSEYSVVLEQPFSSTIPTKRIEIIGGSPNRHAFIRLIERSGANLQNIVEHEGGITREDTRELMTLLNDLRGLPTDPDNDLYGLDRRLMFTNDMSLEEDMLWDNGSDVSYGEMSEEIRDQFGRTVKSIESLARMKARTVSRV